MGDIEFEICKLTSTNIYNLLHERIKGHIIVFVKDDILNVEIKKDDFTFDYQYYNWMNYVHYNGDFKSIVDLIYYQFKKAISGKYFY